MVKININNIHYDSCVDGEGIRSVVFFQGCSHRCLNCHNISTWTTKENKLMSVKSILKELEDNNLNKKVTISGGEPFDQLEGLLILLKELKKLNYNIYVYTGYIYEDILNCNKKEALNYIDTLIDGPYINDLYDPDLYYRGSSNQRIININNKKI